MCNHHINEITLKITPNINFPIKTNGLTSKYFNSNLKISCSYIQK